MNRTVQILLLSIFGILVLVILVLNMKLIIHFTLVFFWRVLLPLLLAFFISYLLQPIINKLTDDFNMNRTSAIAIIFISFFSLLILSIYKGMPLFLAELQQLSEQVPGIINLYEELSDSLYSSTLALPDAVHEQIMTLLLNFESSLSQKIDQLFTWIVSSLDYMVSYLVVPIIVFYFLKDDKEIIAYCRRWIPERYEKSLNQTIEAIDEAFQTYIRGQFILSSFIFLLTYTLYQLVGLKYSFVLSLFISIMNVIPYFGPIIGLLPAVIVSLSGPWKLTLYVLFIALVVQLIESAFLSPYIMGKTARVHPIVIIVVLLVSSELGGILAMVIAIPIMMVLRALYYRFRIST